MDSCCSLSLCCGHGQWFGHYEQVFIFMSSQVGCIVVIILIVKEGECKQISITLILYAFSYLFSSIQKREILWHAFSLVDEFPQTFKEATKN